MLYRSLYLPNHSRHTCKTLLCWYVTQATSSLLPLCIYAVNVDNFAQYIFSRISHRALDARKIDVSENYNHNRTNRNKQHMPENTTAQTCVMGLDALKFNCAKISTCTGLGERM